MNRVHRALVAATTTLAVIAAPAAGAVTTPERADKPDRTALQESLDNVVTVGAVGALAEVRDERGVWRSTSGVAERGSRRAVPVNGRFRAGSIAKTFLATVVLQLVDDDELRLDDTVEDWLPGVVPDGDGITVRHLLNHTSGLYDYKLTLTVPPDPQFLESRWSTWSADELVRRATANPPTSEPPGSEYSYTNTGYVLLGQIVEVATGESYAAQIERRIIRPLGLGATWLPGTSPRIRGPHPHGYVPIAEAGEKPRLVDVTELNPSMFGAGGELISTARDLNRFFHALLRGRLLPHRLLDEMMKPGTDGGMYGLGLAWHETTCGIRVYGNDGDALAYQAWSFSTVDRRRQVTLAITPDFRADADHAVDEFLDEVFCG